MSPSRVPLGDIADFVNGVAFKPDDWEESGKRIIRIQNLTDSRKPFNRTNRAVAKKYEAAPGDLLVSWSATLGVFVWEGPDTALVNQHIFRVVPDHGRIDPRYLKHMLSDALVQMEQHLHGATMKHVNRGEFLGTTIPLPQLAEQQRIAGILDAADALRAKRREALAQLDTLLQSTFLDMFGDPVTNPMGWPPTSLSAISEELRDGPFGSNLKTSHYVESGVRVIRLQNVGVGKMLNDDRAYISEVHFASLPRNHCRPGDVIIGTMGDPNLRAFVVPPSLTKALNKADCILMRVDIARVVPVYVCWLLNSPRITSMALRLVRGQTRGRISLGRLKELQISLPPMELQLRFAAFVESVEHQKARQRAHLAELDTLFASLQSRAFRGDL